MVVPHRTTRHEDWAIATIHPLPDKVHFPNIRVVLEDFLEDRQAVIHDVQRCPFVEAYIQFGRVRDRDRMIRESPHEFGDVFISFTKHNEGRNWRRTYFNRTCWLMLTSVPFDYWTIEDLSLAINKFGHMIM